jgi:hypothetical protein
MMAAAARLPEADIAQDTRADALIQFFDEFKPFH